jgi:phosphoglycerol transferase MdoB-like AlkP superfamily enzyme
MPFSRLNLRRNLGAGRFELALTLLAVSFGIFVFTRVVLLVLSWNELDIQAGLLARVFGLGAVYDFAFYGYAAIPAVLYLLLAPQRWWATRANRAFVRVAVFVTLYALGFIALAEVVFWNEFGVRFNFIAVDYLVYSKETTANIYESFPVGKLLTALLVVVGALVWVLRARLNRALGATHRFRARWRPAAAWLAFPVGAFMIVGQSWREAGSVTYANELASNGPYQFIAAFRNNELRYEDFYATLPANEAAGALHRTVDTARSTFTDDEPFSVRRVVHANGRERRLNVVLVTVESLSADYLAKFGNPQGLTPNLDRLIGDSLFFTHFYATGTRTVRGLEAVTLSIPPTPGHAIVKRIGREGGHWSLGRVLREKGYDARFLYGGRGYFDNMNAFFSGNGYAIVDQSSVPDNEINFANAWGMADEDLYTQALNHASAAHAQRQPFFFHVMTTSNHRPYTFPEGRIDLPSGKSGRAGAVKYTDWAIGDFLKRARKQPWFDDTVFVFLADHCAASAGRVALPLNRYHIPMWVYAPKHVKPREVDTVASQIDVAPTLLALLNMSYTSSAFGQDILTMRPQDGRALIGNHQHLGLYRPGHLWVLSPQRRTAEQRSPESAAPQTRAALANDPGLRETIAYYQGASYVFQHHLNAWDPSPVLWVHARNAALP